MNTSKNLDYPYWNYQQFDLDRLSDWRVLERRNISYSRWNNNL